jgi:hypothetical protein
MRVPWANPWLLGLFGLLFVVLGGGGLSETASAVDVGARAPEFDLPATTGVNISLSDFKGKKWVFLEFYAADFAPT